MPDCSLILLALMVFGQEVSCRPLVREPYSWTFARFEEREFLRWISSSLMESYDQELEERSSMRKKQKTWNARLS